MPPALTTLKLLPRLTVGWLSVVGSCGFYLFCFSLASLSEYFLNVDSLAVHCLLH